MCSMPFNLGQQNQRVVMYFKWEGKSISRIRIQEMNVAVGGASDGKGIFN